MLLDTRDDPQLPLLLGRVLEETVRRIGDHGVHAGACTLAQPLETVTEDEFEDRPTG